MFHSIRLRLLLVSVLIVFVSVAAIALVGTQVTTRAFQGYVTHRGMMRDRRLESVLSAYYRAHGDWSGVQGERERMSELSGERLLLSDASRRVLADSDGGKLVGQQAQPDWGPPAVVFAAEQRRRKPLVRRRRKDGGKRVRRAPAGPVSG